MKNKTSIICYASSVKWVRLHGKYYIPNINLISYNDFNVEKAKEINEILGNKKIKVTIEPYYDRKSSERSRKKGIKKI